MKPPDLAYTVFWMRLYSENLSLYEPRHEKNGLWGFRSGLTKNGLYSHRKRLEA